MGIPLYFKELFKVTWITGQNPRTNNSKSFYQIYNNGAKFIVINESFFKWLSVIWWKPEKNADIFYGWSLLQLYNQEGLNRKLHLGKVQKHY